MKFRFRLTPLLNKTRLEQQRMGLRIAALDKRIEAQWKTIEETHQRTADLEPERLSVDGALAHRCWAQKKLHLEGLLGELDRQLQRLNNDRRHLSGLFEGLGWKIKRLEKVEEQERAKWRRELDRRQQKALDEQTILRYRT